MSAENKSGGDKEMVELPKTPRKIGDAVQAAWKAAHIQWPSYQKYVKKDIDQLSAEYIAKYGYTVLIPDFDDVIHYKQDLWMTREERIERKSRNLQRLISSPAPEWAKSYASAMTWLDNIQDSMTTGLVLSLLFRKFLPRVFARAVPVLGWALAAHDLLTIAVQFGRSPFTPMKAKRALCSFLGQNPGKKKVKRSMAHRLWNMRPNWSAAMEVAQTTDWLFGVGLSLGSIYGYFTDVAFAGYRRLTGEKVRMLKDPMPHELVDITGFKSMQAAAMISSAGQIFDEETHFWTHITNAGNTILTAPLIYSDPPEDYYENPMDVIIPAPEPTNQETRDVITRAGLSIADGVRWPANGGREIPLTELADWQCINAEDAVTDYLIRHDKDWYGYLASQSLSGATEYLLDCMDPGAEIEEEYDAPTHILLQMIKQGITPTDETQTVQWDKFETWCRDYRETTRSWPGINEVVKQMDLIGLSYRTSFPTTQDPRAAGVFPPESMSEDLWNESYQDYDF